MPEHTRPNRSAHQLLRNWHFVSNGTEVPGEVGTQFGIEFPIDGSAVGDGKTLHLVLNFPPQGLRNPNTSDMMHTARIALPNLKIGAHGMDGRVKPGHDGEGGLGD